MYDVLTRLREQFDYIFIDSPPLIAVSDAVRLSAMVDGVVLVVKGHETTRDGLKEACSRLRYARAKILGVVLNRVDMKNGDYGYYHRDFYRTAAFSGGNLRAEGVGGEYSGSLSPQDHERNSS